jgi:hypothetical protein
MGLLIVGLVAGYIAFAVGKWRHCCLFWEQHAKYNLPRVWHDAKIKIGTWLVVAICSIIFASAIGALLAQIHPFLGVFSWGALLAARWYASMAAAVKQSSQRLAKWRDQARDSDM